MEDRSHILQSVVVSMLSAHPLDSMQSSGIFLLPLTTFCRLQQRKIG
jgi:hypothetical protein